MSYLSYSNLGAKRRGPHLSMCCVPHPIVRCEDSLHTTQIWVQNEVTALEHVLCTPPHNQV